MYIQFIPQPGSQYTGWAWLDVLRALCATKGHLTKRKTAPNHAHFSPWSCVLRYRRTDLCQVVPLPVHSFFFFFLMLSFTQSIEMHSRRSIPNAGATNIRLVSTDEFVSNEFCVARGAAGGASENTCFVSLWHVTDFYIPLSLFLFLSLEENWGASSKAV